MEGGGNRRSEGAPCAALTRVRDLHGRHRHGDRIAGDDLRWIFDLGGGHDGTLGDMSIRTIWDQRVLSIDMVSERGLFITGAYVEGSHTLAFKVVSRITHDEGYGFEVHFGEFFGVMGIELGAHIERSFGDVFIHRDADVLTLPCEKIFQRLEIVAESVDGSSLELMVCIAGMGRIVACAHDTTDWTCERIQRSRVSWYPYESRLASWDEEIFGAFGDWRSRGFRSCGCSRCDRYGGISGFLRRLESIISRQECHLECRSGRSGTILSIAKPLDRVTAESSVVLCTDTSLEGFAEILVELREHAPSLRALEERKNAAGALGRRAAAADIIRDGLQIREVRAIFGHRSFLKRWDHPLW